MTWDRTPSSEAGRCGQCWAMNNTCWLVQFDALTDTQKSGMYTCELEPVPALYCSFPHRCACTTGCRHTCGCCLAWPGPHASSPSPPHPSPSPPTPLRLPKWWATYPTHLFTHCLLSLVGTDTHPFPACVACLPVSQVCLHYGVAAVWPGVGLLAPVVRWCHAAPV